MTYVQWKTQQDQSGLKKYSTILILKKYYIQNQNENTDKIAVRVPIAKKNAKYTFLSQSWQKKCAQQNKKKKF